MKLQRLSAPLALGFLFLAIPLLTGANGQGCSGNGGDVVVGGDGEPCAVDSDCVSANKSCELCADGTCGPVACVEGTCQVACDSGQNQCSSDADCTIQPEICEVCPDGTCAPFGCFSGTCGFQCADPPGGQCNVALDCPQIEICQECPGGGCADIDCVNNKCDFVCPQADLACEANDLFMKVSGDGAEEQTYTYSSCPSDQPPSGSVSAQVVYHANGTVGLGIRSCSGDVAWLTLGGAAAEGYPASLENAVYDYVAPNGSEHTGSAATEVHVSFMGEVGQIVEGKFVVQDIPGSLDSLTGYFRACRAPDGQDP